MSFQNIISSWPVLVRHSTHFWTKRRVTTSYVLCTIFLQGCVNRRTDFGSELAKLFAKPSQVPVCAVLGFLVWVAHEDFMGQACKKHTHSKTPFFIQIRGQLWNLLKHTNYMTTQKASVVLLLHEFGSCRTSKQEFLLTSLPTEHEKHNSKKRVWSTI